VICASERLRLVGSHFAQRSRHRGSAVRIKIIPEENLCGHCFLWAFPQYRIIGPPSKQGDRGMGIKRGGQWLLTCSCALAANGLTRFYWIWLCSLAIS